MSRLFRIRFGTLAFSNGAALRSVLFCFVLLAIGCRGPAAQFRLNLVYARTQEKAVRDEMTDQHKKDVADILTRLFGTPDKPQLPDAAITDVLQADALLMAAGPVGSDEEGRPHGLYRKHCVHCHGVAGDGAGPAAAFMDPYPRDFRAGVFKFKSTPLGYKPTDSDLKSTISNGGPGTAMPSYQLLGDEELDWLVHYVKYLSIRGEVERALIYESANELGEDDRLVDVPIPGPGQPDPQDDGFRLVRDIVAEVAGKWRDAPSAAVQAPVYPDQDDLAASVERGSQLFHGPVANCAKCHGDLALGDGQTNDYDDWAKEIDPTTPSAVREFVELGALPPRNIRPRNLRQGVYRGGRRPSDLFLRVKKGIDGTPMPAVLWKADDSPRGPEGVSTSGIWDLVNYVRSLPSEPMSRAALPQPQVEQAGL